MCQERCAARASHFFIQFRTLARKNFLLAIRNWKGSLGQLLAPLVVVLLLLGFNFVAKVVLDRTEEHPQGEPLSLSVPPCVPGPPGHCYNVIYAPKNVPWVETYMRKVAEINGMDFESSFVAMGSGNLTLDGLIADNATIYNYVVDNPNVTQHAVIFPAAYIFGQNSTTVPDQLAYLLFYNYTAPNGYVAEMLMVMDEAAVMLKGNITTKPEFIGVRNKYPIPKSRVAGIDIVTMYGGVWFYIPSMVTFFVLLVEIVGEKEKRLRLGMRMMGMSNTAYWLTWFMMGLIFTLASTQVLFLSGYACGFPFFTNTNYFVVTILFSLFGIAMVNGAFFLSTLMQTVSSAQTIGYAIILVGFVFQTILTSAYGALVDMLWAPDVATWVVFVRWVLTFYPPFNLSKAFSDIAVKSGDVLDFAAGKVTHGPGFFWQDLYLTRELKLFGITVIVPAPIQQIGFLIMNAVFYAILAWYFDNVLPGEHGSPRPFYFFLTPSYWGFGQRKKSEPIANIHGDSAPEEYDSDVEEERRRVESGAGPQQGEVEAVRLERLTKVYRRWALCKSKSDTFAVDNISLTIKSGEIFCLLGHNGAGKTTTINMLTGLFTPTSGNAFIYGMDVETQMDEIREILGVCPQHDILFPELTAREHLEIFAQLKGIPGFLIEKEVYDLLERVGLTDVADHKAGSFSGGMKRRLSIAISLIGSPKIVFLDEPTTGLDPVNRRGIWHLIQDVKQDRCIILTTHSMEEADVLSDRIAIMAFGKIRCLGNSLHLKNKYGSGYRIALATDKDASNSVIKRLQKSWEKIEVISNDAGSVFLTIPKDYLEQVPEILSTLEKMQEVREWGVSHSSLEDVFLNVTKKHNFVYEDIDEDINDDDDDDYVDMGENAEQQKDSDTNTETDDADSHAINTDSDLETAALLKPKPKRAQPKSYPFRALFRKNFALQSRQHFTNCCQVLTPVLVMVILVILRQIIRSQVGADVEYTLVNTAPFPLNTGPIPSIPTDFPSLLQHIQHIENSHPNPVDPNKTPTRTDWVLEAYREHFEKQYQSGSTDEPDEPTADEPVADEPVADEPVADEPITDEPQEDEPVAPPESEQPKPNVNCLIFFYFSDSATQEKAGYIHSDGNSSGVLSLIRQRDCLIRVTNSTPSATKDLQLIQIPYAEPKENESEIQSSIFKTLGYLNTIDIGDVLKPPTSYMLPDGYFVFNELNTTAMRINVTFAVNDLPTRDYHRPNNFTRADIKLPKGFNFRSPTLIIEQGFMQLVSLISRAFAKWILIQRGITSWGKDALDFIFVQPFPYVSSGDIWAILELFGTFLYPLALSLQLPIYIYILALEKAEKLRELMLIHGMRQWQYHLTNYVFFYLLYAIVAAFFWIGGFASSMRFFTQTHWSTLLAFNIGWGFSLVSMAFLLSAFVNSPRAATIVGYAVALFGTMIGLVVSVGIYGPMPYSLKVTMPLAYYIWPQFSFARSMYLLNDACAEKHICYGPLWKLSGQDEVLPPIIAMFISGVVFFMLFLYLDAVLPRQFGVPKHPLFCFLSCCRKRTPVVPDAPVHSSGSYKDDPDTKFLGENEEFLTKKEDEDVLAERRRVYTRDYDPDAPLVLNNLRKVYPGNPPKVAVHSLCLVVEEGECFALLGENGAGKTTTISMLTGLFPPTDGWATVGGFDIRTDIDSAHLSMGLCAQFDILWDDLTVLEHALFYARLKGVPPKSEMRHVERILRDVGLWQAKDKKSSALSGGMKRRLSICISLVGNSRIVFMDEPTSGIDATTRRQLWKIIQRAKRGRAIVLTTHAMEEAELLSTRIGIISKGELRCIGNQQRLKNKFGDGYRLKISFKPANEAETVSLITKYFPTATLSAQFRGTREYHLGKSVSIAEVFDIMVQHSAEHMVDDWSINQIGLEDVFRAVITENQDQQLM